MRSLLILGTVLLASGCAQQPPAPTTVSWQYGAGNGDGVQYPGPKPVFSRSFGMGNGESVTSGQTVKTGYGYGADGMSGTMVQTTTPQPTMTAQPQPNTHSGSSS